MEDDTILRREIDAAISGVLRLTFNRLVDFFRLEMDNIMLSGNKELYATDKV